MSVAITVGVVAASYGHSTSPPQILPSQPIDRTVVEGLLEKTAAYAHQGDFTGLCATIAASDLSCKGEIEFADQAGWHPDGATPVVIGSSEIPSKSLFESPVLILRLAGTRADGTTYEADFAAMRTVENPTEVKIVTPVYWSGVEYERTSR